MASEVLADGTVIAPLNITAPAPTINLQGFQWGTVDEIDAIRPGQEHSGPSQGRLVSQGQPFQQVQSPELGLRGAPPPAAPKPAPSSSTGPDDKPLSDQLREQLELKDPPKVPHKGPFFPLEHFQGAWAGNGFNMIFRPLTTQGFQASHATDEDHTKDNQMTGSVDGSAGPSDNILEVNLTTEQVTFGTAIGDIPNRGLGGQPDIVLAGMPYLQTVQDVTNGSSGKGDKILKKGIHFEPGMWLNVPGAKFQNGQESIVRMASIPHGTTINAQGFAPTRNSKTLLGGEPGGPEFNVVNTTPFFITAGPGNRLDGTFGNMNADDQHTRRVPQDLSKFSNETGGTGLITTDIIKNPNLVLQRANTDLEILETIAFEVHTGPGPDTPKPPLNAGGTANIAFLCGQEQALPNPPPTPPFDANPNANADAFTMSANYWVERINYKVMVPGNLPGGATVKLNATMPPNSTAPTPQFLITVPRGGNKTLKEIKVPGLQIQSSQNVTLNFFGISWPHVSVSTLVPTDPQKFQMT